MCVVHAANNQTFTLNGGNLKSDNAAITMNNTGDKTIINGGTITSTNNYGVYLYLDHQTLEINGGDIKSKGYGIYARRYNYTIDITGGTITSTDDYGLYLDYSTSSSSYFSNINILLPGDCFKLSH